MKINIINLLIIMLLISNILIIKKLMTVLKFNDSLKRNIERLEEMNNMQLKFLEFTSKSEDIQLDKERIFIDENEKVYNLNEIMNEDDMVFVMRYSEISCKPCIDENIEIIKKNLPEPILKKTIFIVKYSNPNDLVNFKRFHQLKNRFFRFDHTLTPIDSLNISYFFCLNKNGEIGKVFIPKESNIPIFIKYLKSIN